MSTGGQLGKMYQFFDDGRIEEVDPTGSDARSYDYVWTDDKHVRIAITKGSFSGFSLDYEVRLDSDVLILDPVLGGFVGRTNLKRADPATAKRAYQATATPDTFIMGRLPTDANISSAELGT